MKTLLDFIASLFNWFKIQSPHTSNKVWYFMDNVFVRCYLAGREQTDNRQGKSWHGLALYIVTKNHPDCTNGFKAIRSHHFWLVRSRHGNFGKGGLWRKWDSLASKLRIRFHYIS